MKCGKPIVMAGKAFGCGQCLPCRLNKRRVWTHRIILESMCHSDTCFVTLTYDDEHLPADGSLVKEHYVLWLKRLRRRVHPLNLRFFIVGEYGDESERPHYHAALFGLPGCFRGRTLRRAGKSRPIWRECCSQCLLVGETWGNGDVDIGTLTDDSAGYIAGYTVKKMTAKDDIRLRGRVPEFARMSLRPYGIGAGMMDDVSSTMLEFNLESREVDVPGALRHGSKLLPLDRYLRRRLRRLIGRDESTPEKALAELEEEMRDVWLDVKNGTEGPTTLITARRRSYLDKAISRERVFKKRSSI